jgi:hypothetical protein
LGPMVQLVEKRETRIAVLYSRVINHRSPRLRRE